MPSGDSPSRSSPSRAYLHRTVRKIGSEPHVITLKRGAGGGVVCDVYHPQTSEIIHSCPLGDRECAGLRYADVVETVVNSLTPPPPPPPP